MNPVTHLLMGWSTGTTFKEEKSDLDIRKRGIVVAAGLIPDFDGFGAVIDFFTRNSETPTELWGKYHHLLGHNICCATLVGILAFVFSKRNWLTTALALLSFHLHILGDILGGRGPLGNQWPIPYFYPFSTNIKWAWEHQWALNASPNFVITGVLLLYMFRVARQRGISPLEFISAKWNAAFVKTLRDRFGAPRDA